MPLMHSKTPKAFKKNIETEMEHGKPQKQAVAIAYSEKAHAEHKKHLSTGGKVQDCPLCFSEGGASDCYSKGACIGPSCEGCSSPKCMADGGEVEGEMHLHDGDEHEHEDEDDHEIHGMLGEELMNAMERKDHKAIMQCIEACIMNCLSKGEME